MNPKSSTKISLVAPCGMNCGICMAYLREKNTCPGCRLFDSDKPVTIAECRIRRCQELVENELRYCYGCKKYPCDRIKHIDKRYRTKYGMSMIENLDNIKKYGIRVFVKSENTRWACPHCGGVICVHKGYCLDCGK
jgi:hypothetical protein